MPQEATGRLEDPHRGTGYPAGLAPRTGTITVKGVFPNPRNLLRPGQYAA